MKLFELFGTIAVDNQNANDALDATSRKAADAEGAFDQMRSGIESAGRKVGTAVIGMGAAAVGAIGSIMGLASAGAETVEDMGKLDTAFTSTGKTSEQARGTFQAFVGLLGETDQSVEAANHLAQLCNNQEELAAWSDIAAGAYATFGDSMPLEGLTEAANETARVGTVTGSFADALNWTSASADTWRASFGDNTKALQAFETASYNGMSAEDAFNEALKTCTTEQERAALITQVMNGLYGETGEQYRETNKELIASREAQANFNTEMGNVSKALMPAQAALLNLGASILQKVLPYVEQFGTWFAENLPTMQGYVEEFVAGVSPTLEWLGSIIGTIAKYVLPALKVAFEWFLDNLPIIAPAFLGVVTALGFFTIATQAAGWITTLKTAFTLLTTAMKANPWVFVVTAIVGLVTWLVTLYNTNEDFRNKVNEIWAGIKTWWTETIAEISAKVSEWVEGFKLWWEQVKTDATAKWEEIKTSITTKWEELKTSISEAWESFKALFDWENIKTAASTKWDEIKTTVSTKASEMAADLGAKWEEIKTAASTKWEETKAKASEKWESIKTTIGTKVGTASATLSTAWSTIKTTASTKWDEVKTTAETTWANIQSFMEDPIGNAKTAISGFLTDIGLDFSGFDSLSISTLFTSISGFMSDPIGTAKETISGFITDIQGFFDGLNFQIPHISLPHFNVSVPSWNPLDWVDPAKRPSLSVDWYAKGAVFDEPTIFPTASGYKGVGEAGAEAVAPIGVLQGYVAQAVRAENGATAEALDRLYDMLEALLGQLLAAQSRAVVMDSGALVGQLAPAMDAQLGRINRMRGRGW